MTTAIVVDKPGAIVLAAQVIDTSAWLDIKQIEFALGFPRYSGDQLDDLVFQTIDRAIGWPRFNYLAQYRSSNEPTFCGYALVRIMEVKSD